MSLPLITLTQLQELNAVSAQCLTPTVPSAPQSTNAPPVLAPTNTSLKTESALYAQLKRIVLNAMEQTHVPNAQTAPTTIFKQECAMSVPM